MKWKKVLFCLCLLFNSLYGIAQSDLSVFTGGDTIAINKLLHQSKELVSKDPQRAISVAIQAKKLAEKINFFKGQAYAIKNIGMGYYVKGEMGEALTYWRESLNIFEKISEETGISNMLNNIAAIYFAQGDDKKALEYSLRSLNIAEKLKDTLRTVSALVIIGSIYRNNKATEAKALNYLLKALPLSEAMGHIDGAGTISANIGELYFDLNDFTNAIVYFERSIKSQDSSTNTSYAYNGLGKTYLKQGDFKQALNYHTKALAIAKEINDKVNEGISLEGIANVYNGKNDYAAAINYYNKAITIAKENKVIVQLKDLYLKMALTYSKTSDYKKAFKYKSLYAEAKDTLYETETNIKLGSLQFDLDMQKRDDSILLAKNVELQELRFEKFASRNALKTYTLVGCLTILVIVAVFLYRNNRQKQKAKTEVEQAFTELKSAQAQLIQSEKMASLGELTAGIAHEIQNPLNFVNNFSEVNQELIEEVKSQKSKLKSDELDELLNNIADNEEKINHHGKRADAIVKSMLQHSRASAGQKEPTDINALADEYLRLAYQGQRAKDKSFNVKLVTDFDQSIHKINIIPQDIGRVLLNLFNNAFYAAPLPPEGGFKETKSQHEPTMWVKTSKLPPEYIPTFSGGGGGAVISVRDNGPGIPPNIIDKIFQPFFTTKPTGQGTGLGLSLSYDIIKAHGGELKVETKEGEGTEFIIQLPA